MADTPIVNQIIINGSIQDKTITLDKTTIANKYDNSISKIVFGNNIEEDGLLDHRYLAFLLPESNRVFLIPMNQVDNSIFISFNITEESGNLKMLYIATNGNIEKDNFELDPTKKAYVSNVIDLVIEDNFLEDNLETSDITDENLRTFYEMLENQVIYLQSEEFQSLIVQKVLEDYKLTQEDLAIIINALENDTTFQQNVRGVGIVRIEQKEVQADGIIYTIYLSDNTNYDFKALKGPQGIQGEQGKSTWETWRDSQSNNRIITQGKDLILKTNAHVSPNNTTFMFPATLQSGVFGFELLGTHYEKYVNTYGKMEFIIEYNSTAGTFTIHHYGKNLALDKYEETTEVRYLNAASGGYRSFDFFNTFNNLRIGANSQGVAQFLNMWESYLSSIKYIRFLASGEQVDGITTITTNDFINTFYRTPIYEEDFYNFTTQQMWAQNTLIDADSQSY